jgi:2-hydroxychromene-2-carboxylate isomerase
MSNAITSHKFSTKVNKDAATGIETQATIEWDVSQDIILAQAARSLVIDQQALYRISGTIPTKATLKASEILAAKKAARGAPKVLTQEQLVSKATENPEVLRAVLLAAGLTEAQITKHLTKAKA